LGLELSASGVKKQLSRSEFSGQHLLEKLSGVRLLALGHLFGSAFGDDAATGIAPFRTEIDDPVGGLDDVEVVFDSPGSTLDT
jgi:hypothetical protein